MRARCKLKWKIGATSEMAIIPREKSALMGGQGITMPELYASVKGSTTTLRKGGRFYLSSNVSCKN